MFPDIKNEQRPLHWRKAHLFDLGNDIGMQNVFDEKTHRFWRRPVVQAVSVEELAMMGRVLGM
jgi:hypothetical protein